MFERAANCRVRAKDWLKAAHLFRDQTVPRRPAQAAQCFEQVGAWEDAAVTWVAHGDREKAIKACEKGREWDLGVNMLQSWSTAADSTDGHTSELEKLTNDLESFAKKAALFQLRSKTAQMSKYTNLLSTSAAVAFFQRYPVFLLFPLFILLGQILIHYFKLLSGMKDLQDVADLSVKMLLREMVATILADMLCMRRNSSCISVFPILRKQEASWSFCGEQRRLQKCTQRLVWSFMQWMWQMCCILNLNSRIEAYPSPLLILLKKHASNPCRPEKVKFLQASFRLQEDKS
jgi:hypothetical protein